MKLNSTTGMMFHDWVRGRHDAPEYVLNELSSGLCMVYGTGSAQIYIMAMLGMIHFASQQGILHVLGMMPQSKLEELIDTFRTGAWHSSKTQLEQVSNYWLKPSQSYSQQYTKSITGSTLDQEPPSKTPKKLAKDIASGKGDVKRLESDPSRGSFYTGFGNSPFALQDVVDTRDSYFDDHGNKARAQTTHGKPMKTSDLIYDAMIRRSCKFLLYDSIQNGKRVVYLLDDLTLPKVAYLTSKSAIPPSARIDSGPSEGKVPICTTELREIFRNWDYFQRHLKFYLDFVECPPPWAGVHGNEKEWALYAKHRAQALLAKSPSPLSSTQTAMLQTCVDQADTSPTQAIASYHGAMPSRFTKGASLHVVDTQPETV